MEKEYLDLLNKVIAKGELKGDRTGTGTLSLFGHQMRFDLSEGFPLLTTKKVAFGLIKSELLWFLKGDSNIRYLLQRKNHIWDEWAFAKYVKSCDYAGPDMTDFGRRCLVDEAFNVQYKAEMAAYRTRILTDDDFAFKHGDLGPVYGRQWRYWEAPMGEYNPYDDLAVPEHHYIDQITDVIKQIKTNPESRRLIVSAWNPAEVSEMALPPCHTMFQFYVSRGKLSCQLYQRSADIFLGVPFNIASYALLTHLIANETGLEVGEFIHTLGDAHLYTNHLEQATQQLSREPYAFPTLRLLSPEKNIFDLTEEDIVLENYQSHPAIKAPIAV